MKYVPKNSLVGEIAGQQLYQYTAIDECTRWRYASIFEELSTYSSVQFVKELRERFAFEIICIQTDNGAEFTSRLLGAKHPSAFEVYLEKEGIRHKTIPVATPRHNGKVERSHRTDGERFYKNKRFYSMRNLRQEHTRYIRKSNARPLMAHNWKSANDQLSSFAAVL